jgi:hypothetical protein
MSPTATTAPGTASRAAATPAVNSPNQYHLSGHGVHVSYYPGGIGPVTVDGPIILTYQDAQRSTTFRGVTASVTDVANLGTIVTVKFEPLLVSGGSITTTTAALLIPAVVLPAGASTTVHTELITGTHLSTTGPGPAQRDHYAVTALTGEASHHPLPE